MKIRSLATVAVLILCVGCNTLAKNMKSFVGSHRDELIQRWGPPDQEAKLSTGGSSLVYSTVWGDGIRVYTCRKVFNTDASGIIKSWNYSGC